MVVLKVFMLGRERTGKSMLVRRMCGKSFKVPYDPTKKMVFDSLRYPFPDDAHGEGRAVLMQIWDYSGSVASNNNNSAHKRATYYKDSHCCVLVVDKTKPNSVAGALALAQAFRKANAKTRTSLTYILVINKIDTIKGKLFLVTEDNKDIVKLIKLYKIQHIFELSAAKSTDEEMSVFIDTVARVSYEMTEIRAGRGPKKALDSVTVPVEEKQSQEEDDTAHVDKVEEEKLMVPATSEQNVKAAEDADVVKEEEGEEEEQKEVEESNVAAEETLSQNNEDVSESEVVATTSTEKQAVVDTTMTNPLLSPDNCIVPTLFPHVTVVVDPSITATSSSSSDEKRIVLTPLEGTRLEAFARDYIFTYHDLVQLYDVFRVHVRAGGGGGSKDVNDDKEEEAEEVIDEGYIHENGFNQILYIFQQDAWMAISDRLFTIFASLKTSTATTATTRSEKAYGLLSFHEIILGMHTLIAGTLRERGELIFSIYDYISRPFIYSKASTTSAAQRMQRRLTSNEENFIELYDEGKEEGACNDDGGVSGGGHDGNRARRESVRHITRDTIKKITWKLFQAQPIVMSLIEAGETMHDIQEKCQSMLHKAVQGLFDMVEKPKNFAITHEHFVKIACENRMLTRMFEYVVPPSSVDSSNSGDDIAMERIYIIVIDEKEQEQEEETKTEQEQEEETKTEQEQEEETKTEQEEEEEEKSVKNSRGNSALLSNDGHEDHATVDHFPSPPPEAEAEAEEEEEEEEGSSLVDALSMSVVEEEAAIESNMTEDQTSSLSMEEPQVNDAQNGHDETHVEMKVVDHFPLPPASASASDDDESL